MITALLLAATVTASPIASDGRVDAPEGFRARLPAGLRYSVDVQNGVHYYQAADRAGDTVVRVGLSDTGAAAQCQEAGETEVQPGVRMKVSALRTREGLAGCMVQGRSNQGALALAVVYGPERNAVLVLASAKAADRADRLARGVVESVRFAPAVAVDPRIVGCFRRESSSSVSGGVGDSPYFVGVRWTTRCLRADRGFLEQSGMAISGARSASDPTEGRWALRAGRLQVWTADESWAAAVQFEGDDLVLDGELWERQSERADDEESDDE